MIPMMVKEAVVTKFSLLLTCNFVVDFTTLKKQLSAGKTLSLFKCQLHFKQYTKERVCFVIKLYKITSSNDITLVFLVNSRRECFIMAMRIVIRKHQKEPLLAN